LVVETNRAIEVEATTSIVDKLLKVRWPFTLIVTIQLTGTPDRKYRLTCIFFVWAKLTLGALFREAIVGVSKRKVIFSASFRSTYTTRCTPSLRITDSKTDMCQPGDDLQTEHKTGCC